MGSNESHALGLVLRKSNFARTTGFDLVGDDGFELLQAELASDFPYLTLAEVNAIVMQGVKGRLDKYKSLPLNFTRIYQWVAAEAPKQPSAWRAKFPETFAWADLTGTTEKLLLQIATYQADQVNQSIVLTALRRILNYAGSPVGWVNYEKLGDLHGLLARFQQRYPEFAKRHAAMLY